jgi:transcriptional regulator with XRE-family HTH domain
VQSSRELPTVGREWRQLRRAVGLTQLELARRTELDPSTIRALENDRLVSDRTRLLVAAALGLQVFPPVAEGAAA